MAQQFIGIGSNDPIGKYLRKTREDCIDKVKPRTRDQLLSNVTACILDKFTETDKAVFALRQYILTLWPAFVGAIVATAPDPALMVYDNLWWAALFATTCGGLPGSIGLSDSPSHHVEALTEAEGRSMCEAWQYSATNPTKLSKAEAMGSRTRRKSHLRLEWVSFFASLGLWLFFCIYFAKTLQGAVNFIFPHSYNGAANAIWYYMSCSPAIAAAILELLENRVILYEPIQRSQGTATRLDSSEVPRFQMAESKSRFLLWLRVMRHQWQRSSYRILIRDTSSHWVLIIGRMLIGIGRITVFAYGSIVMGNIILMPIPNDFVLLIVLVFTTAIPRQLWPAFWTKGNRGADLVVFVKSIRLTDLDSEPPKSVEDPKDQVARTQHQ